MLFTVEIRKVSENSGRVEIRRTNAPSFVKSIPGALFMGAKASDKRGELIDFALNAAQGITAANEAARKQRISSAISEIFQGRADTLMVAI